VIPLYDVNPAKNRPRVTRALILVNVVVFLATWLLEARGLSFVASGYGLVPIRIRMDLGGEWFTIFSSMFLHASVGHIFWNMLFLYIFGDNVEDKLGSERFLAFYLFAGVGAALGQYAMNPASHVPMVGASGAIGGVLGAYLVLHPRAPVAVLNPIFFTWFLFSPVFALPAWVVVGEWFIGNVFGVLNAGGGPESAGVAFAAHLGGFLVGLLSVRLIAKREALGQSRGSRGRSCERTVFWRGDKERPFWK
jgi:membrane associated rhomboid family serine protease